MENIENKVPNGENQDMQNSSFFSENVSSSNGLEAKFPLLRFRKFSHPWKQEKLSDFTSRIMRKNSNNETELPLTISSKDGLVDQVTFFNKKVSSKDMSGYYLLKNGEFAYNKSYSNGYDFGSIKRLERYEMGALSTLYICFSLKKHCSDYIKHYFDSLKWYRQIYVISAEGARNHGLLNVPTDDFFATTHYLSPDIEEQKKIADFLSLVDQRIEKQRQLVESLKKYKRGALSRVFNDIENWEKTEAKDIATIETGCSNTQDNNPNGLYPFYIRSANIARSDKYIFDGEAVLTIGDGQIGKIYHYINGKFDCHQRVYMITKFKKISGRYFYHFFSTFFYNRAIKMSAKNTVDSVRMDMIAKMPIYFPDKAKQKQIVSTLDTIDSVIDKQTKLLEQMTSLKKGFLQQMFI